MKNSLINFSVSLLVSFIIGLLFSLIITILKMTLNLDPFVITIIYNILSYIPFFVFGFLFSYKMKKRGIINGLLCSLFYLLIILIFNLFKAETSPIYIIAIRTFLIIISSIIGVNLSVKNDQIN